MLQPDAFCVHTMQQNLTVDPLGSLLHYRRLSSWFKGENGEREGMGQEGKGGEGQRGMGKGRGWKLEQGRTLAKTSPE